MTDLTDGDDVMVRASSAGSSYDVKGRVLGVHKDRGGYPDLDRFLVKIEGGGLRVLQSRDLWPRDETPDFETSGSSPESRSED